MLGRTVFGLAVVLLGIGSSMNDWQRYGKGWLAGDCYTVRTGVYLGTAVLIALNLLMNLSLSKMDCAVRGDDAGHEEKQRGVFELNLEPK